MVQVCDFYILLYLWWCLHNMWNRLLIDWLLNLERKKQISLWHIYIYMCVCKVQNKLVQHIPPPPPPPQTTSQKKTKENKCDLFCACLYFEEDILFKQNR